MNRFAALLFLAGLFLCLPLTALDGKREKVIEDFDYVNSTAAQKVWSNGAGTPPVTSVVHEGQRGARISVPFSQGLERTIHDREILLDLAQYGYFTISLFVENPEAFNSFTLYFRSGGGWYSASDTLTQVGWQRMAFYKAAFRSEGNPIGWHRITGIRISAWAAEPINSSLIVARLAARSHEIVVITPTTAAGNTFVDIQVAQRNAKLLTKMLEEIGIPADIIEDRMVPLGILSGRRLAILPLNPKIPVEAVDALQRFVAGGGKLFVTYSLVEGIAELLNLRRTGWMRQERSGQFASIQLDAPEVTRLPESVKQASWNITIAEPTDRCTRIIGYWYDDKGDPTEYPALFLGDNGVFFSHIVLPDDRQNKQQLLAALFAQLVPEFWRDMAKQALNHIASVGHLTDFDEIGEFAKGTKGHEALKHAQELRSEAQTHYVQAAYVAAVEDANAARTLLSEAYLLSHPSPKLEGRAVWNHSGTGAYPGDWNRSAKELAKAGFNMIISNMLWAGLAHYPSDVLPRSEIFAAYGDQVVQCVEAAHRHGLEVHIWKVSWNLQGSPDAFVEKMRAAGRTQVSRTGAPINWLCPSHPDNVQLELNSLLEVVREYDVDGIHFDYIRYPGPEACYCDGCRERFTLATRKKVKSWPGDVLKDGSLKVAYLDWRTAQITRLVRLAHKRARALRPDLKISAAVFGNYPACVKQVGQDWVAWVDAGYVDFLCPMDYTDMDGRFTRLVERQLELTQERVPIYPGIGAASSRSVLTPDRVVGQIHLARSAGAPGFTIFDYSISTASTVIRAVGISAGTKKAKPIHDISR